MDEEGGGMRRGTSRKKVTMKGMNDNNKKMMMMMTKGNNNNNNNNNKKKKKKGKSSSSSSSNPRQIPAFGNWDNDLPITQYFESALQAGLVRYSSSSSFSAPSNHSSDLLQGQGYGNVGENRKSQANAIEEGRKQVGNNGKVFDVTVTELPPLATGGAAKRRQAGAVKKVQEQTQYEQQHRRAPKAVDEDLYKIPPELIKRKRRLGFFSRCLVPSCAV